MPAGLVAMSPWTDLAITGESYTKNREIDPVFGADGGGEMLLHSPYIGENDAKNPLISPMYGNFTGFPPMLIQVGTHEMLYDDAASVAKKAKEQGVLVRFTVYEGMFHVFQMSGTVIPESKRAWEEVGAFMHKGKGEVSAACLIFPVEIFGNAGFLRHFPSTQVHYGAHFTNSLRHLHKLKRCVLSGHMMFIPS